MGTTIHVKKGTEKERKRREEEEGTRERTVKAKLGEHTYRKSEVTSTTLNTWKRPQLSLTLDTVKSQFCGAL